MQNPEIRFKDENGKDFPEWREIMWDSALELLSTNSLSRSQLSYNEGEVFNIHHGDIHSEYEPLFFFYKEKIPYIKPTHLPRNLNYCIEGDLLIADASEDVMDIGKAVELIDIDDKKIVGGLHTFLARNKKTFALGFKVYLFKSYYIKTQLRKIATGVSVIGISQANIRTISLPYPSLPEQSKIVDFLSAIDKRINLAKNKIYHLEEYKKGLLQQVFSQQIRFKDEDGKDFPEWEEKIFSDFFEVKSSKRVLKKDWKKEGIPFYRTRELVHLANRTTFSQDTFISEEMYQELKENYGVPSAGDLLVSGVGTLGIVYKVHPKDVFYFKDANVLWFKKKQLISSIFITYIFAARLIRRQIFENASITTVGTYTIQDAKSTFFLCPSLLEQEKIADFLSAVDRQIEIFKKKLEGLEEYKKGLLQKMFV